MTFPPLFYITTSCLIHTNKIGVVPGLVKEKGDRTKGKPLGTNGTASHGGEGRGSLVGKKTPVNSVSLHLKKAFLTLSHHSLIGKLMTYQLKKRATRWAQNYPKGQTERAARTGKKLSWKPVNRKVPWALPSTSNVPPLHQGPGSTVCR